MPDLPPNPDSTTLTLRVVHAAERFVIIDKPSGLLSVPGKGPQNADCVAARVRVLFPTATGPLTVHRLDMATSGLIILALDPDAHRDLSRQFEARTVRKRYIALLDGLLASDSGEITLPMRLDITRRPYQIVDHELGKPAHTRYRVLERRERNQTTLVEFEPLTGRSHQLRVHAAQGLQAPIVGDPLYGRGFNASHLHLHASWIEFACPSTRERIEFSSAAPFATLIN